MKQTTKEWLILAEEDLLAARTLSHEDRLTNLVSFHCQQCLEKCFKAMIEEQDFPSIKSHDLIRLQLNANIQPAFRPPPCHTPYIPGNTIFVFK